MRLATQPSGGKKFAKDEVDYSAGKPHAHCGSEGKFGRTGMCDNYISDAGSPRHTLFGDARHRCRIVAGVIEPDMWCNHWTKPK